MIKTYRNISSMNGNISQNYFGLKISGDGDVIALAHDNVVDIYLSDVLQFTLSELNTVNYGSKVVVTASFIYVIDDEFLDGVDIVGKVFVYNLFGVYQNELAGSPGYPKIYNVAASATQCAIGYSNLNANTVVVFDQYLSGWLYDITCEVEAEDAYFGKQLSFSDNYLHVSAENVDLGGISEVGKVYVYNGAVLYATISPDSSSAAGHFGKHLDSKGGKLIIGSPAEDKVYFYEEDGTSIADNSPGNFWTVGETVKVESDNFYYSMLSDATVHFIVKHDSFGTPNNYVEVDKIRTDGGGERVSSFTFEVLNDGSLAISSSEFFGYLGSVNICEEIETQTFEVIREILEISSSTFDIQRQINYGFSKKKFYISRGIKSAFVKKRLNIIREVEENTQSIIIGRS